MSEERHVEEDNEEEKDDEEEDGDDEEEANEDDEEDEEDEEEGASKKTRALSRYAFKCVREGIRVKTENDTLPSPHEYDKKSKEVRDVLFASFTISFSLKSE